MKLYSVFSALMTSITLIALIAGSGGNLVFEFLFLSSLEIEEQIFSQKAKNYKIFLRNNWIFRFLIFLSVYSPHKKKKTKQKKARHPHITNW